MDSCFIRRLLNPADRAAQKNWYAFSQTQYVSRQWKEQENQTDGLDHKHDGGRPEEAGRDVMAHSRRDKAEQQTKQIGSEVVEGFQTSWSWKKIIVRLNWHSR